MKACDKTSPEQVLSVEMILLLGQTHEREKVLLKKFFR
jgi:hypothetical protein